ncbi:STM4012 family radical SAM protein [Aureibacter tunicatorum]|uniref:Oxygen-independent coproporphyrinogen-3 oxidase n=1 Tax=Aureibacter tunicatorum TaxID=866807 RepID=A0AAE3XR24_9BACT|nr:STM4012 family radical SAM protein [Aureibacter tunicatorum]MDR6239869.1 oxygen-independent coproporphyrinogen-3 oxidase [Aureibacter tunicatorum]BDD04344.1 coproporphyrinogen III oxidase [Aureibacter tunicatorum]
MRKGSLKEYIKESYFHSYAYSYPHKMSYRSFEKPVSLKRIWEKESKDNLFLYLHVPFCEMRCGFCNLFTIANPKSDLQNPFVEALFRQIDAVKEQLGALNFANVAWGGGTPSYLSLEEMYEVHDRMKKSFGLNSTRINTAIEVSPKTITTDKIAFLKEENFFRVSMGVQSFIEDEVRAMGRPQRFDEVERAIKELKNADFPLLNLDLIYGAENQTPESWQYSLDRMLEVSPEEVFLYPLYVRPLTGLGKQEKSWDDFRMGLYLQARDFLMKNGYEQITMRQFKKIGAPNFIHADYHSQENGMIGLGVGARSYTRDTHYSSDYAVGRKSIKGIISDFNEKSVDQFSFANYGTMLNIEEQKRRYLIKSFCEGSGLETNRYNNYFQANVFEDFADELEELEENELISFKDNKITLTLEGRALEDVIGPWLYSEHVKEAIGEFDLA